MVDLSALLNVSPNDEEAFIEFERLAREQMERAIERLGDNDSWEVPRVQYMSAVQAAFDEFEIGGVGNLGDSDRTFTKEDFSWFNQAVTKAITRLQVRAIRRTSSDLIVLDSDDKTTLIKEVGRLKNRVTSTVDLTEERKQALIKRLDALLEEIEKPRFDVKKFAIAVAAVAGAAVGAESVAIKAPETIVRLLEVVDLVRGKEAQRLAVIEHYRAPRAIEHKPDSKQNPSANSRQAPALKAVSFDLDDEIPF